MMHFYKPAAAENLEAQRFFRRAIELAQEDDAILITGKGTDNVIKGPRGTSQPWSDAEVAREEIRTFLTKK